MKFTTAALAAILGITGSEATFNGHLVIAPNTFDGDTEAGHLILTDKDTGAEYTCTVNNISDYTNCKPNQFCVCDFVETLPPGQFHPDTFGVELVLNNRCLTLDFLGNKGTNKLQCCNTFPCDLSPVA